MEGMSKGEKRRKKRSSVGGSTVKGATTKGTGVLYKEKCAEGGKKDY